MIRVAAIIGARPQFVKCAPVSRALAATGRAQQILIHSGQHHDQIMSDVFFDELDLPRPDHMLNVHGGGHGNMTGRMMIALEPLLQDLKPDWVLVYGDTNTTLAGALTAAKLNIPVAHVEAGLRSFNTTMPEEINRVVVDHVSAALFAPTAAAMDHLKREGLAGKARLVGDVMYDAVLSIRRACTASTILERLSLNDGGYALATLHRAESTADACVLAEKLDYLKSRAVDRPVVLPLHPRTRDAARRFGSNLDGLRIIDPVGLIDMHRLMQGAAEVLTDSGGVQKEACFHGVPCVTLRNETEWVETVECGWNRLWTVPDYAARRPVQAYGDGRAAEKIAAFLVGAEL